jgi:hypothetical protein
MLKTLICCHELEYNWTITYASDLCTRNSVSPNQCILKVSQMGLGFYQ